MPGRPRQEGGVSPVALAAAAAAALVLVAAGAIGVVSLLNARETSRRALCAANLAHLYRGIHIYRTAFGGGLSYPPHTGRQFLMCLKGCSGKAHPAYYRSSAPFKDEADDLFTCPDAARKGYRGPQLFVPFGKKSPHPSAIGSDTPASHPIACDPAGNHAKTWGNVLLFDGTVVGAEGEAYTEALESTE